MSDNRDLVAENERLASLLDDTLSTLEVALDPWTGAAKERGKKWIAEARAELNKYREEAPEPTQR